MNKYVRDICKAGQGAACCRYLAASAEGIICLKLDSLKPTIDARTDMIAKSDNCDGKKGVIADDPKDEVRFQDLVVDSNPT